MHYIWNRAERVSEHLMPHRIIECFKEWEKNQKEKLKNIPDPKSSNMPESLVEKFKGQRYRINYRLRLESRNLKEAVDKFNNK